MDGERANGRDALAIPHNSNASNGEMFARETYDGNTIDAAYGNQRILNEPLVEVSQVKGTSDTHPMFSPNDEWADFEPYDVFIGSTVPATVNEGDFVRKAFGIGLDIEDQTGTNPYAFGLIGSSDTHTAAGSFSEDKHIGKFPADGVPEGRGSLPFDGETPWPEQTQDNARRFNATQYSASGLAGVWAESNTREAIFDAMRRKETFGTSGPRMKVRFFAGMEYDPSIIDAPDLLEQRYERASKMAGILPLGARPGDPTPKIAFFWSIRSDRIADWRAAPLDEWKAKVRALWPAIAPLLDQIGAHDELTVATYRHRTLRTPLSDGVVHIGDSYHAASPQLGQGANMALLDAAALDIALAEAHSWGC